MAIRARRLKKASAIIILGDYACRAGKGGKDRGPAVKQKRATRAGHVVPRFVPLRSYLGDAVSGAAELRQRIAGSELAARGDQRVLLSSAHRVRWHEITSSFGNCFLDWLERFALRVPPPPLLTGSLGFFHEI